MSGSKEKRRAHGLGREKEDVCGSFSKKLPDGYVPAPRRALSSEARTSLHRGGQAHPTPRLGKVEQELQSHRSPAQCSWRRLSLCTPAKGHALWFLCLCAGLRVCLWVASPALRASVECSARSFTFTRHAGEAAGFFFPASKSV